MKYLFILLAVILVIGIALQYWPLTLVVVAACIGLLVRNRRRRAEGMNFGDPYQKVRDYLNAAHARIKSWQDGKNISAEMDWFGDGDIYDVYLGFDDGVLHSISLTIEVFFGDDSYEAFLLKKERALKFIRDLESFFGIIVMNPEHFALSLIDSRMKTQTHASSQDASALISVEHAGRYRCIYHAYVASMHH